MRECGWEPSNFQEFSPPNRRGCHYRFLSSQFFFNIFLSQNVSPIKSVPQKHLFSKSFQKVLKNFQKISQKIILTKFIQKLKKIVLKEFLKKTVLKKECFFLLKIKA